MQATNKLGLQVVVITTLVAIILAGAYMGIRSLIETRQQKEELLPANELQEDILTKDTDSDGLPDALETIYRTDPNNPDSDGDGTSDGDEIVLKRDPTTAGPDDSVETNLSESSTVELKTYTERYFATLPSGASREVVFDQTRLTTFVDKARQPLLHLPADSEIRVSSDNAATAVQTYITLISPESNSNLFKISPVTIQDAFSEFQKSQNDQPLKTTIDHLQQNITTLTAMETPAQTKELHRKLIAASVSLMENTKLLNNITQDPIGALVGAKNIEELSTIFQEISTEITQIQTNLQN